MNNLCALEMAFGVSEFKLLSLWFRSNRSKELLHVWNSPWGGSLVDRMCLPSHQQQKAAVASLTEHASLMKYAKDTLLSGYSRHQL